MTQRPTNSDPDSKHEPLPADRYAAITVGDDSVLVYDVKNTTMWVESDTVVSRAEMR